MDQFGETGNGNQTPRPSYEELRLELDSTQPLAKTHSWDFHFEFTSAHARGILGIFVSILIAFAWVAGTELLNDTYKPGHQSPFFIAYFSTAWLSIFYPCYFLIAVIYYRKTVSVKEIYRDSILMYKKKTLHPVSFLWKTTLFCLMFFLTNYVYIRAIMILSPMDVTALFSTNQSFIYMLSWIVLFEKFVAIRIIATIFSITGIVLFAYVDGFGSPSMWGVVLASVSACSVSVHKVLYKKFVGDATYGQISLFLSLIGLGCSLCLWPILLALYFTQAEVLDFSKIPWDYVCGTSALLFVYQLLAHYGVTITYQVFHGFGLLIGLPLCAFADIYWRNDVFAGMKTAAVVLIGIGLLLILLPGDWQESMVKVCCLKKIREPSTTEQTSRPRLRGANLARR